MTPRPRLSLRDRRALRLGAVVLLPVLAWMLVVRPWRAALSDARGRVRAERELLVRERELLADVPRLPMLASRASRADSLASARVYLAADPYAAGASLAGDVTAAAESHGLTVREAAAAPPVTRPDGLTELEVALRTEGDLAEVLALLRALEGGARLTQVTGLAIERQPAGEGTAPLALTATLRAYARAGAGGAP
ncbi:MAG TPA: type II secretion system protein GspM [Gemmatimonadaceae bacterium]|nr:type II secretion system protein GspM [Gemmatimonadaceae bacterium]